MTTHHTAGAVACPAQSDLFVSGQEGCQTFRIPGLAVTAHGVRLAFAEGRKDGGGDGGAIDLLLKRSCGHGAPWQIGGGMGAGTDECVVVETSISTAGMSNQSVWPSGLLCWRWRRMAQPYERLTLARFTLTWLTDGVDKRE